MKSDLLPAQKKYRINVENMTLEMFVIQKNEEYSEKHIPDTTHSHIYAELFVCTKGSIYIKTQDDICILNEGDLAIVPPKYQHIKIPSDNSKIRWDNAAFICRRRNCEDTADMYSSFEKLCSETKEIVIRNKPEICKETEKLITDAKKDGAYFPALKLVQLLTEIIKITYHSKPFVYSAGTEMNFISVLDYIINSRYTDNIKNSEIADMLYISVRQLNRIAVRHLGMSMQKALNSKRTEVAEKLLTDTTLSAESISEAVGFCSKSAFYREFHKKYNTTPLKFRKNV